MMNLAKRVIPAGINNHDVHAALCGVHLLQNKRDIKALVCNLIFTLNVCVDRDKVITTLNLDAMPRVIDQANIIGE